MCKDIIFQKCHFNNIYYLFHFIVVFLNILMDYCIFNDEKDKRQDIINNYLASKILNNLYIANLSDFLSIIPYLIMKRLLKKKGESITNNHSGERNLIHNDSNILIIKKKKKTYLMYLSFVGILDFLEKFSLILYNILWTTKNYDIHSFSCIIPFEIICQFICSYIILKIKFHKLQYLSLFLNLVIFIVILIFDIVVKKDIDRKIYFFYPFNVIFYSIEFSLAKKILLHGYISIYLLIILKGSIVLILSIIFSLIIFFTDKGVFSEIGKLFAVKQYIGLMIVILQFFYKFIYMVNNR